MILSVIAVILKYQEPVLMKRVRIDEELSAPYLHRLPLAATKIKGG